MIVDFYFQNRAEWAAVAAGPRGVVSYRPQAEKKKKPLSYIHTSTKNQYDVLTWLSHHQSRVCCTLR